jgi:sortase A
MLKALITIIIIVAAGIGIGTTATNLVKHDNTKQVLSTQSTQPVDKKVKANELGIPVTVKIPKINVNTAVESVGNDKEGRMDVPKNANNTAWYSPGYRPGQVGNAVLAGHYDKVDGSPSVFWNVKKLTVGDKIMVIDNKGKTQTFAVTKTAKYPDASFPINLVFGTASVPMLNLITCNGTWNKTTKNYSDRLVVYSQLVK